MPHSAERSPVSGDKSELITVGAKRSAAHGPNVLRPSTSICIVNPYRCIASGNELEIYDESKAS
jgi:hypothetical protein